MLQDGRTWFLLADGRRARVLIEERRGAQLEEPAAWKLEIGADELYSLQDRAPRSQESVGSARHAMDGGRDMHEMEEEKFLRRVATLIGAAEAEGRFEHLVIAAAPRALGLLRAMLPDAAKARIRADTPKDLLDEGGARLRERLHELLR